MNNDTYFDMIVHDKYKFSLLFLLINCSLWHIQGAYANNQIIPGLEIFGNRYELTGEVDLNGGILRLPQGAIFDCRNGVIKNGTVKGCGNKIIYNTPFIGDNLIIDGLYVIDRLIVSENILVNNRFSNAEIHNVCGLARKGSKIVFEHGIYNDVAQIILGKDIELDFSNSVLNAAVDQYGLSSSVFTTEVESKRKLKKVIIKNLIIDGQKPYNGQSEGTGLRRNAIRLMNVQEVYLNNVEIRNFETGTGGYYAKNVKERYMEGVCNITNYRRCEILNCALSLNTGEGFFLVPQESNKNYTLFKNNISKNNQGTFLTLVDGRCIVEDNEMEGFGFSGMNVFCYNSVIRNNHFKRGARFNCIDITENGLYWPRNVKIYGNEAEDCVGFIMVAGENITIKKNICRNPRSAYALTIFGHESTNENSPAYLVQRNAINGSACIKVKNNEWTCKGGIATYKGCQGDINICNNIISIVPDEEGKPHRGSSLELNDCKSIKIENNIFRDSFRNAMANSNVYITINECYGEAIIRNNSFMRTLLTSDKSTFFLYTQSSLLERLTIVGNKSNIVEIEARTPDGMLSVSKKKIVRNNGSIDIKGVIKE